MNVSRLPVATSDSHAAPPHRYNTLFIAPAQKNGVHPAFQVVVMTTPSQQTWYIVHDISFSHSFD